MTMPHCDQAILHAPGACRYCDLSPELQEARERMRIAFTGSPEEMGTKELAPCPSTHFRSPEVRDRWGGNVSQPR